MKVKKKPLLLIPILALAGCVTVPPKNINNACTMAQQYPNWYYDSLNSYKKWGIPISVQWAIIRNESSFIADAKTPMQYAFGFIPTGRQSTAYGYAQALNGTWDHYQKSTGNSWADRTNFADAVDFIGWYGNYAHKKAGISKSNAYELYLAYNQGIGGYLRGNYRNNQFLLNYARKTQDTAYNYAYQLRRCNIPSKSWFW
ncbi:transglycosylase SLT domain-containing protein [Fastidiosibacter lacustris]|uniref:transglycosylase SLT domain-containing protein n=1 Tax=Fastidiosibacter lacustris TaxID=2056695 RepID=UPI000E34DC4F|nr:transglycosylase SLT domain-containing protein [Fastidiosibacter lacustris]